MVVPGAPVAADVVDPVATEAGLSVVDSSRKLRTPLPSWPRTSGSFPAPKTIRTTARMRRSSGPPIFGIVYSQARLLDPRCASMFPVYAYRSDEQAVEKAEEQRNHDEKHERGQVADDQNEHEATLHATGRVEASSPLRRAQTVAVIADDHESAAAEIARPLEVASDRGERHQLACRRLAR